MSVSGSVTVFYAEEPCFAMTLFCAVTKGAVTMLFRKSWCNGVDLGGKFCCRELSPEKINKSVIVG